MSYQISGISWISFSSLCVLADLLYHLSRIDDVSMFNDYKSRSYWLSIWRFFWRRLFASCDLKKLNDEIIRNHRILVSYYRWDSYDLLLSSHISFDTGYLITFFLKRTFWILIFCILRNFWLFSKARIHCIDKKFFKTVSTTQSRVGDTFPFFVGGARLFLVVFSRTFLRHLWCQTISTRNSAGSVS